MDEILRLFPDDIKDAIQHKVHKRWGELQEIRFRLNQPLELIYDTKTEWIHQVKPKQKDGIFVLNQLSSFSLYRMEDELREGYVTIEGGHRVGLAGKVNTLGGAVKAIKHITFFNIRIAKQKVNAAAPIAPFLYRDSSYMNTLFIGPPQTGKTTLIRDIVRLIATGWKSIPAKKVAVIDERSEIGGSIKGVPQHNVGLRTDLMDACPKAEGMMMMIRSMSPDILVVDEIGSKKDVQALMEAILAGVIVICSVHGQTLEEIKKRPSLQPLFQQDVFKRFVLLERQQQPGIIKEIYDQNGISILEKERCLANGVDRSTSIHRHHYMDRF
ncbi:stage III sporulation protein AA [Virgibacillus phasianinus]|uniref:Stage III sporulation protein AA n=1 Tax=Virgibacillus phasianinus TaxID=2017483 RepID=A0A220U5P2_9BACI|nr:stage III sporulation protein AA [Virgibacillus phasianinus]ASK63226.1 stage III sporulation protein AA [Virgibacillus phasianinus]